MKKLLFLCHGNICRSPMSQFVMQDLVNKVNLSNEYEIDSAAVSREEIGNGIHYGTREIFRKYKIPYTAHYARQMTKQDAEHFDLILCMDQSNINRALRLVGTEYQHKIQTLLPRNIADPWYTDNFEETYQDVLLGCQKLLEKLEK